VSTNFKPAVNQPFSLSLEQLSFLSLLAEKFNLTDDELKLTEYLVTQECRNISIDRFRTLDYEPVCLGAALYVLDQKEKEYSCILEFIEQVYSYDKYKAGSLRLQTYKRYRNYCDSYFASKINYEKYEKSDKTLKLKQ
jgi:hypothetical protein